MSGLVPVITGSADNISIPNNNLHVEQPTTEEFGNKYRRLVELDVLCKTIKLDGVSVPPTFGFSREFLYKTLKSQAPEVFDLWSKLSELYITREAQQEAKAFLVRSDVQTLIKSIQDQITSTFTNLADNQNILNELGLGDDFHNYLASIKGYLMVRSSGDEDTWYANAGGNISIAYVPPVYKDVWIATGKAVASFFGTESLLNRLNAKANPFVKEPIIAICLQQLIGEDDEGIPAAVVLFTNEPSYGGNERFRIMTLSASFGHGEAVVGNRGIQTDSYFLVESRVDPSEVYTLSNIKDKKERLGPGLEKTANPTALQTTSTLSESMLKKLYILGKSVEEHYEGKPCDMELVIKNDIIYPVQVRPINRAGSTPTYIDPVKRAALEQSPVLKTFYGNSQVVGAACVQLLKNAEELVIAPTLEEAEKGFYLGKDKVVLFQQPEPQESHFVVNFAGMGVPCIQIPNIEELKAALHDEEKEYMLVVDVQEGSVTLWDSRVDVNRCISQGYFSHPAPISITLSETKLPPLSRTNPKVVEELKALIANVKASSVTSQAVEILKNHPLVAGFRAKRKSFKAALQLSMTPRCIQALHMTKALDKALQKAFQEAMVEVPDRLESLFHIKVLQQLLLEPGAQDGSLGKLSLATTESLFLDMQAISSQVKRPDMCLEQLDLILDGNEIPLEESKSRWIKFVGELNEPETVRKPFFELLDLLRSTRSIQTWITLTFNDEASNVVQKALDGIDEDEMVLLHKLQNDAEAARQMKACLTPFSDEESCLQTLEKVGGLIEPYQSKEMLTQLNALFAEGNLAQVLIAQKALIEVIDLFDRTIKTIKMSSCLQEQRKSALFVVVVKMFFEFFEEWMKYLLTDDPTEENSIYMLGFRSIVENLTRDDNSLLPSDDFEVAPALMFARTNLRRHEPKTYEDLFTLVHQNLLDVVGALAAKAISCETLKKLPLPEVYKKALDCVPALGRCQLLGIDITASGCIASFNLPIRNHSSTFDLVVDGTTNRSYLNFRFLGQARGRWDVIRARLAALSIAKHINLVEVPKWSYNGLSCRLELTDNTVANSFAIIKTGVEISLETAKVTDRLPLSKECLEPHIASANDMASLLALCRSGVAIQDMVEAGLDPQKAHQLLEQICQNGESVAVKQNALTYIYQKPTVDQIDVLLKLVGNRDLSICNGALDNILTLIMDGLSASYLKPIYEAIVDCSVSRSQFDRRSVLSVYHELIERGLECYEDAYNAVKPVVMMPSHFVKLTDLYLSLIKKRQYRKEILDRASDMQSVWDASGQKHAEAIWQALLNDDAAEFKQYVSTSKNKEYLTNKYLRDIM
ncbi:MAG: PEP/pyruvate-binding domain-containing protein [Chlamydiales bacterium]|nr:PEP/pyruvate-binding domain-containing protein [Chlamydiales bacterium]